LSDSEVAVESKRPLTLEDLFPFPIPDEGKCSICDKDWENHYFMDFFLNPKHRKKVLEFLKDLTEKLSETMYACIKVASNTGSAELTPKEIVKSIMEYVEKSPEYADLYLKYVIHEISSQKLEFQYRTIADFLFSNTKTKFRSFVGKWLAELKMHRILGDPKIFRWFYYGLTEEIKKDAKGTPLVLGEKRLLQCVLKDNNEFYMKFLSEHELDATDDYFFLQEQFYEVVSLIDGFQKATEKLVEPLSTLEMAGLDTQRRARERKERLGDIVDMIKRAKKPRSSEG